ncbi:hypothetical protein [Iningainema tapete]|uniref:Uncharacterized protein n=1 Tax=Iningainema tapete BLCC-T55 TaxID=2748662 RepID=A0A8J6XQ07_9CYAN|nr:hypothetical protein [Iningainema tapete]MBD2775236.1 hypothetical protein [Iningainema tapete BLCC-T55]
MINTFRRLPRDLSGSPDIRIVGPRSAGKTTFMASLARWPNAKPDGAIQSVNPFDDQSGKLIAMAKDILENGLSMAPTRPDEDVYNLPLYTLLIELKPAFIIGSNVRFQVSCREYSGEIIKDLRGESSGINLSNYLDDCANSSSLLLLIDGTSREDNYYSQAFARLQTELNERLVGKNKNLRDYRVAVVFSKAEQSQVWIHRHEMQKFVNRKFPLTKETLRIWVKSWGCSVNYFFCSAFGMKGSPPSPNVKVQSTDSGGTYAAIANPAVWQPFGLVAPIYWLYTGKDDRRLRTI